MKLVKQIVAICFFIICTWNANSQTIPITDSKFKQCLVDSFPSALDASQNLIVSQAAGITALKCPDYGIVTVDELPYFTGLIELNLTKNPIVNLPDMSALGSITKLNIGQTSLTTLPDFADFPNLHTLSIHRLSLTQFPDLSGNQNLVELVAHSNNFNSIPALNLPNLEILRLALVGVTSLPDLSNLPKLRTLECFRNSISQLPDLSMLDSLKVVDASTNLINQFPNLPPGVQTLYLDYNSLTSLPDLTFLTSLTKVRLFKNYLSFEDLLPLSTIPGFSTVYEIAPQKKMSVGYSQSVVESLSLSIDSRVDTSVANVARSWYFNNGLTGQSGRYFTISQTKVSDQGYYYSTLTHPSFPGLVLQTDSFSVSVIPCVNPDGISLDITESNCMKQGALKINLSNQQQANNYGFELEGISSQKKTSNTSGTFSNLEELSYNLTIHGINGCKYTWTSPVDIPREPCKQIVITPNGDNVDDNYYFQQTGTAKIIDKWGNLAAQLSLPLLWDGNMNGRKIPVGYYLVTINNGEEVFKLSVIY